MSGFSLADDEKVDLLIEADIYDDIPAENIAAVKQAEMDWMTCKTGKVTVVEKPQQWMNFLPAGINGAYAMGFFSEMLMMLKQYLHTREFQQIAILWRCTLRRCRHKDQWKMTNETFVKMLRHDEQLKSAAEFVFTDESLNAHRDSLPETRLDPLDKTTEGLHQGQMERAEAVYQSNALSFEWDPPRSDGPMYKVSIRTIYHGHKNEHKRQWKPFTDIAVLGGTFPTGVLCKTSPKRLIAFAVAERCIRVEIYDTPDKHGPHCVRHITTDHPLGILWSAMSPDGTHFAVSNERQIYTWSNKDDLVVHSLEGSIGLAGLDIANDGELTFGSVVGHVVRVKNREPVMITAVPDTLAIISVVRTGQKTVVQTIRDLYIVEAPTSPNDIIQIRTSRPMILAVMGTRICSFNKYGHLLLFNTIQRNVMTEVDMGDDKTAVVQHMPWYSNGLHLDSSGRAMSLFYPDGSIRTVRI